MKSTLREYCTLQERSSQPKAEVERSQSAMYRVFCRCVELEIRSGSPPSMKMPLLIRSTLLDNNPEKVHAIGRLFAYPACGFAADTGRLCSLIDTLAFVDAFSMGREPYSTSVFHFMDSEFFIF